MKRKYWIEKDNPVHKNRFGYMVIVRKASGTFIADFGNAPAALSRARRYLRFLNRGAQ